MVRVRELHVLDGGPGLEIVIAKLDGRQVPASQAVSISTNAATTCGGVLYRLAGALDDVYPGLDLGQRRW